jgi:predicted ester cyclase
MPVKENRALTKRVFEALSKGDLTAAQKVLGADLIAEGEKVVARWTATGTHKGAHKDAFFGSVKGTGKPLSVSGITILRFEGGRVVETWGLTDELGAVKQLGLVRPRG